MTVLFRDFESRSTVDIKKMGAWQYATHPSTDVLCCAYAVDDGPVFIWVPGDPVPLEFIEAANNPDWVVSAFNDSFERLIEQHIMAPRHGWPIIPIERHRCTQAAAAALALPASLGKVAIALGLEQQKDDAGRRLMLQMCKPRKDGTFDNDPAKLVTLAAYCKQDVVVERAVYQRVGHLSDDEQRVWIIDQRINDRGVPIDRAFVAAEIAKGRETKTDTNAEITEITGGAVTTVSQTARLIAWLSANGCEIKNIQKATLSHALRRKDLPDNCRRVIELRQGGAHPATSKLSTILAWASDDDRIRGAFKYHGAAPGRWTSFGVQLQNLKKGNSPERYSICAAPGHRFIKADLSGIESRMLAWVAGEESKIAQWALFDQTGKPEDEPYYANGINIGFRPEEARGPGKTCDLAFGYGGGVGAYRKMAPDDPSTDEEINTRKSKWRENHQATVRFWYALGNATARAVANPGLVFSVNPKISCKVDGDFLFIELPNGRRIAYPFPQLIDDRFGNKIVSFKDTAGGKFADCNHGHGAWFGIFVENVVQAVARDIIAGALLRLEDAGYPVVLHIHDEIVAEVAAGVGSLEDFIKILTTPPAWAPDLPLAAKGGNGPRFGKAPVLELADGAAAPEPVSAPWDDDSDIEEDDVVEEKPTDAFSSDEDIFRKYTRHARGGSYVCEHIYRDPTGKPHQKAIRTTTKEFLQEHWDGTKWVNGAPDIIYPYRLPELIAAGPDAEAHIFEGEKDADNGVAWGLVSTTNPGGAGNWSPALSQWLITLGFKKIVVHIDNDEAGRRRKAKIGAQLGGAIADLRFIEYSELPENGDFTDWQDAGGTLEQLRERIAAAEKFGACLDVTDAGDDTEMPPPRAWLLGNIFCRQFVSSLLGDGGVGKTAVRYAQYLSAATMRNLVGDRPWVRCRVLLLSLEDGTDELRRRIRAARQHHGISLAEVKGWLFYQALGHGDGKLMEQDAKGRLSVGALTARIEATIKRYQIDLVAFDPFVKSHAVTENDNNAIDAVVQVLADLAIKYDMGVDAPHHVSKGQAVAGDAQKGRGASAFVDGGRLIYTLSPMSPEEAEQFGIEEELRRYYVRMDKGKVNITPPARYATWFKLVGIHLGNATEQYPEGDNVQTVETWVPPEIWDDFPVELQNLVLDDIDAGLSNEQRYSNHPKAGDRAAWDVVIRRLPDKTKKQAREIISAWLRIGALEEREYHDPVERKDRKGLYVVADKRPK